MINRKFGRLLVLEELEERTPERSIKYLCQCDCGVKKQVTGIQLRKGTTNSCGCLRIEKATKQNPSYL